MSIARNTAWNLVGVLVPTLFVVPSLALYGRVLGVERLGLLTLALSLLGYATNLDLGLSRALIREVAIHADDPGRVRTLVDTTTACVAGVAALLAALAWGASPALVNYLKVSAARRGEAIAGFHWLALSVPPFLLSLVATAYFEGREDFRTVTWLRLAASGLSAGLGVAGALLAPTLVVVMAALCASRWLAWGVAAWLYRRDIDRRAGPAAPVPWRFATPLLRRSLATGGWLTLTNLCSLMVVNVDRFVLANLAGARVVAFYTVPSELVFRLLLVPGAISRALFPRLSKGLASAAADRRRGLWLTLAGVVGVALPAWALAPWLLTAWMGADYAGTPAVVLRILLVGFVFNALALGPFTDLQARGYARTSALIHLAEVGPYLAGLLLLTRRHGVVGTAMAWSLRTGVDCLLMAAFARWHHGRAVPPRAWSPPEAAR